MKRTLLLAAVAVSFIACGPGYHLRYAVVNETDRPVYCVDKNRKDASSVIRVEPDSAVQVYEEMGFGPARPQFRESRTEVSSRFVFYSDSTLSDSSRVLPEKGWKYYPLPIGAYNARVYIRPKDLR